MSMFSFFFFFFALAASSFSLTESDRFIRSVIPTAATEYIELAPPLPTDKLIPSCSYPVFTHTFADTYGRPPFSVKYSPPFRCRPPWSHVVLQINVSSEGDQYDRIAAVWLAGSEILRTSTAEPTENGIFWNIRKDVTRYTSLLKQSHLTLTVMLENLLTDDLDGVYDVTLTFLYYKNTKSSSPPNKRNELGFDSVVNNGRNAFNLYETPADEIIPISNNKIKEGFWFRINSKADKGLTQIKIPLNTIKAVVEIYVSYHGDDEFWYSNPPDSYIKRNNLTTKRGGGSYREVSLSIDGLFITSVVPFPVIFTGGINPLSWEPVVSIGAFNLPSYDFDLTPFLGRLLDDKIHSFGIGVGYSIPFWLVDANLHIWFDHGSAPVQARLVEIDIPPVMIKQRSLFQKLDGSFDVEAKRKNRITGWIISSSGNLTTHVLQQFKFKNQILFEGGGSTKTVSMKVKAKMEVIVESADAIQLNRAVVKTKYPLVIITSTVPGLKPGTYKMTTNVSHGLIEKWECGNFSSLIRNSQDSLGWMSVKDHSVLSGSAQTNQSLSYEDQFGCYWRAVMTKDGKMVKDNSAFSCQLPY
ncbi:peptide-N4-(N-acetyl-beta-glucosaminyl)asparagine amidase A [Impatiens glandulifera]|uniref:peptide-N4-(N-acetyl-beta- glucosaminyl)asparagine amidase A n=1 Tax=Impatiens glandulifera TaxID=253017 RepID=UPI001FB15C93|nr:peptide-N4-(N-acetyl-beta-glucosaminyl)asparagine amidase A [Impatiens glandulifera]